MAWHDAGITRFSQWWRRMTRNGHGLAQVTLLSWRTESSRLMRLAKTLLFGLLIPLLIATLALLWSGKALLMFLIYPLQALRLHYKGGFAGSDDLEYCIFTVLSRVPMSLGALQFCCNQLLRRRSTIIEYK
jgi:hypothetical protein